MLKKFFAAAAIILAGVCPAFFAPVSEAALGTDVVGAAAITSFGEMIAALPSAPVADEAEKTWTLRSPDGEAFFTWRILDDGERAFDVYISVDPAPFVAAGLDMAKLPAEMKLVTDKAPVSIGRKLSEGKISYDGEPAPASSFEWIVKLDRDLIGYHTAMDHYGVSAADGFVFEWAKDMSKNDKDIVFVLDPKPFIDAGADPSKVEGWNFSKVPLEDEYGRPFEADKFLKPFDLK